MGAGSATVRELGVVEIGEDVAGRVGYGAHGHGRAVGGQSGGFRAAKRVPDGDALVVEVAEESREGVWAAVRVQQMSCRSANYRPRH